MIKRAIIAADDVYEGSDPSDKQLEPLTESGKIYLFSAIVLDFKNLTGNAHALPGNDLAISFPSTAVVPKKDKSTNTISLQELKKEEEKTLLQFEYSVGEEDGNLQVDFATQQPSFQIFKSLKSMSLSLSELPKVDQVIQTDDLIIVDVKYSVISLIDKVSKGSLTVRYTLVRRKSIDLIENKRTIAKGLELGLGFFGNFISKNGVNIRRFKLNKDGIIFLLKDVPEKYKEAVRDGVLAWNKAFPEPVIKVETAEPYMDIGDPRFNVVKWVDNWHGTKFGGVASPTLADPVTGTVYSGGVLLNGTAFIDKFTKTTPDFQDIGGDFSSKDTLETRLKKGYQWLVVHEIGHVLGLRHHFMASANAFSENRSLTTSVMDYLPFKNVTDVGPYDIRAIQWGYFGEQPNKKEEICHENLNPTNPKCLMLDLGDPAEFTFKTLNHASEYFSNLDPERQFTRDFSESIGGTISQQIANALKIRKSIKDSQVVQKLNKAIDSWCSLASAQTNSGLIAQQSLKSLENTVLSPLYSKLANCMPRIEDGN